MSKVMLITVTLLLTSCYNQKPSVPEGPTQRQGAIITDEGAIIFYHNIWGDIKRNLGLE